MLVLIRRLLRTNQRHQGIRYRRSIRLESTRKFFLDPSLESPCPPSLAQSLWAKAPSWLPRVPEWPATILATPKRHCPHKICLLQPLPSLIAAHPLAAPSRLAPSAELPHLHPCHRNRRGSRPQSKLLSAESSLVQLGAARQSQGGNSLAFRCKKTPISCRVEASQRYENH